MKKKTVTPRKASMSRPIGVFIAGIALVAGAFLFASGSLTDGSNSLLAAVFGVFSNQPSVTFSRSETSPSGIIPSGVDQNLASFNVTVRNVKWQANLQTVVVSIPVTGTSAANTLLTNIRAHYKYCIPQGTTYGYGYKGGSCGTINLEPKSSVREGNTYKLTFMGSIPVYPNQSYGAFIVSGKPGYTSKYIIGTQQVRVEVASVSGIGDQCRVIRYGYKNRSFAYTKCGNTPLNTGFSRAVGNTLSLKNPYGYKKPIIEPPVVNPQAAVTPSTNTTGTTNTTNTTQTDTSSTGSTGSGAATTNSSETTQTGTQTPAPTKTIKGRESIPLP